MRKRSGVSPIISETLLIAIMITIVISVLGFAVNLFSVTTQETEFSQARNLMVNFAQGVDVVTSTPGGSTFVRFNSRSGGPVLVSHFDTFSITTQVNDSCGNKIAGTTFTILNSNHVSVLRYKAGSQVSFIGYSWLRGNQTSGKPGFDRLALIIRNNTFPNGWVYESNEPGFGVFTTLDYRRADLLNFGILNVSQGVNSKGQLLSQKLDILQLSYTNVTLPAPGSNSGSNNIVVTAQSGNATIRSFFFQATGGPSGNVGTCTTNKYWVQFSAINGEGTKQKVTIPIILPATCQATNTACVSTQIQLVQNNVKFTLGGA
jgi:hypothetical protein